MLIITYVSCASRADHPARDENTDLCFCIFGEDALRRYQVLEVCVDSPKLPAGYLTLAPLLFVPPLWRRVMDPVLHKFIADRAKKKGVKD